MAYSQDQEELEDGELGKGEESGDIHRDVQNEREVISQTTLSSFQLGCGSDYFEQIASGAADLTL